MYDLDQIRQCLSHAHEQCSYARGGEVRESEDDPTIIVHLSHEEQAYLDQLIGGPNIDPRTGRRDYSPLKKIIDNPMYKALFEEASQQSPGFEAMAQTAKKENPHMEVPYEPAPGDSNKLEERIDKLGTGGDDSWSLMPASVAKFFDKLIGGKRKNPNTGFRMYGNSSSSGGGGGGGGAPQSSSQRANQFHDASASRGSGSLNGSGYGTASRGSGSLNGSGYGTNFASAPRSAPQPAYHPGNAFTNRLNQNQAPWDTYAPYGGGPSLSRPGPMGEMRAGNIYSGSQYGKTNFYNSPNPKSGGASNPFGLMDVLSPIVTTLGGLFGGLPGAAVANTAFTAANTGSGDQAVNSGIGTALGGLPFPFGHAAQFLFGRFNPLGNLLESGLNLGAGYMAEKERRKGQRDADRFYERQHKEHEQKRQERRKELGLDRELQNRATLHERVYVPQSREDIDKYGPKFEHTGKSQSFKEGGPVEEIISFDGDGTGQSDSIPTHLMTGDWIADADTVSKIGDGDTTAGRKRLRELYDIAGQTPQSLHQSSNGAPKKVPARTSTGEEGITRELVIKLGGGDLHKGTNRLNGMRENLRLHKNRNVHGIPPRSLPISHYMPELR